MAKINPGLLKALDMDQEQAIEMLPGTSMGLTGGSVDNPKVREIAGFLYQNPLYIDPVLNFIRAKSSAIAAATLQALYTPEELQQLMERQGVSEADRKKVTGS